MEARDLDHSHHDAAGRRGQLFVLPSPPALLALEAVHLVFPRVASLTSFPLSLL